MLRCLVPSLALACVLLSVNSNAALTPEWAQQEVQVDVALDFDNTKGKSHLYERSSEHSGLPSRKLLTSQDLPKKAPAPLPVPLAAPQSGSSPLSTSPSGSYASTLSQVTVVMVADVGSQASLRAAHCTWLSMLDPAQVVHMTDFELRLSSPQGSNSGSSGGKSRNRNGRSNGRGRDSSGGGSGSMLGGCGFPVTKVVKVKFAIDYYDIMHQLYVSEVPLQPWVLVVKPWTFVHPRHLAAWLATEDAAEHSYVGRVRNASSELASLAMMPHVAYEYGMLMRSWCVTLVGKDKEEYRGYLSNMRKDFHTVESGVADIAATLYATPDMVAPHTLNDRFVAAFPNFQASEVDPAVKARLITMGPLEPRAMFDLADTYGFFDRPGNQPHLSPPPPLGAPGSGSAAFGVQNAAAASFAASSSASPSSSASSFSGIAKSDPHSVEKQEALRARMASESSKFQSNSISQRRLTELDDEGGEAVPLSTQLATHSVVAGGSLAAQWARYQRGLYHSEPWRRSSSSSSDSNVDDSSGDVGRRHLGSLDAEDEAAEEEPTTSSTGAAADTPQPAKRPAPPRVLYAVLARESGLGQVVVDAVSTWASADAFLHTNSSVLFFYSATEVAKYTTTQDLQMRNSLTQTMNILAGNHERAAAAAAAGRDFGLRGDGSRKRTRGRKVRKIIHHGASAPGLKSKDAGDNGGSRSGNNHGDNSQRSLLSLSGMVNDVFHTEHQEHSSSSSSSADGSQNVFLRAARGMEVEAEADSGGGGGGEGRGEEGGTGSGSSVSSSTSSSTSPFENEKFSSIQRIRRFHRRSADPDYVIDSPYKCAVSENLAPPAVAGSPFPSQVRTVGLYLPPQPKASSSFYKSSMGKPMDWHLWLRVKVRAMVNFLTTFRDTPASSLGGPGLAWSLDAYSWFVVVDDDTYVKVPQFLAALEGRGDPSHPTAVGRKFFQSSKGSLLGGGPGIAMSRGAMEAIRKARCTTTELPILGHTVPGGDGWLGQCMNLAKVTLVHDWRFKSLPPYAFAPNQRAHAISFHKSHVKEVHAFLQTQGFGGTSLVGEAAAAMAPSLYQFNNQTGEKVHNPYLELAQRGPLCPSPVLLRDLGTLKCLPLFTIIGAQKAGTTSLFKYLGQHPQVTLPAEKELNFWGTPWPLTAGRKHLQSLGSFTFNYLKKFKLNAPGDARKLATGEASPDYLVSTRTVLPNILRFAPTMKVIVSLREPINRCASAYENKVADKTVHKHLDEQLFHGHVDKRKDDQVVNWRPPTMLDLAQRVNITLAKCPDYTKHYTLAEKPAQPSSSSRDDEGQKFGRRELRASSRSRLPSVPNDCYVNPFVLHGYYAKYLRPWVAAFGKGRGNFFVVDFDELEANAPQVMTSLSSWLQLSPYAFTAEEVYNSRNNRGVHSSAGVTGGKISGMAKDALGTLDQWSTNLPPEVVEVLSRYYAQPNRELRDLLGDARTMAWAKK